MPPGRRRLVVERAADVDAGTVQHMGVNHGGSDVLVAEQFLNGTNVIPVFKQVRGEAVSPRKSYTHAVGVIGFLLR